MNPILEEIYSTIIPSAPYVIVAYALIWVALLVYVFIIARGTRRAQQKIALLEEELESLNAKQAKTLEAKASEVQ